MAQRESRRSTQQSTKASLAVKKRQETEEPTLSAAALSLVTMQKEPTERSNSNTPELHLTPTVAANEKFLFEPTVQRHEQ